MSTDSDTTDTAAAEKTKRCPTCQITKPLTDFYAIAARYDGRSSHCKPCSNRDRVARYGVNSDARPEHKLVMQAVKLGLTEKPEACDSCQEVRRLRYVLDPGTGEIRWECSDCRHAKPRMAHCDWCCREFTAIGKARFCGSVCMKTWLTAKVNSSSPDLENEPLDDFPESTADLTSSEEAVGSTLG